tara:strand:- start:2975 stop:5818 length:2844 start_codon:yes stop_codon:yes gene_type:complete
MALERGSSLNKGVRRTGVEGSFGVVRTAQNTIGTSIANASQTVDKITQFQVDVMDKEWQNNFDTSSAIFIEQATREELNSQNPDLVKLREKFITYRDTQLKEAPQRFQNYITNKLDINFVDSVNNVKDYANDLKFINLSTQGTTLANMNYDSTYSSIQTIIKNNKGNNEKIQQEIDLLFVNEVLPNIASQTKNDIVLSQLKPLEMTPAMIEERGNKTNIAYETLRNIGMIEMMVANVNFDSNDTQKLASDLEILDRAIDDYIENYVTNPDARKYNMDERTIAEVAKNLETTKTNLLSVQQDKIQKSINAETYTQGVFSTEFVNNYKNNSRLSIESTPKSILESLNNTDSLVNLYNNPELFAKTLNSAIEATSIHKIIAGKQFQNNGVLPNIGDLTIEINTQLSTNISEDDLSRYVYSSLGGLYNYTADQMVNDVDIVLNNPTPDSGPGGFSDEYVQSTKNFQAAATMMQNGYYPPGLNNYFSNVDRIMTKTDLTDLDITRVNQSMQLFNYINNNGSDVFFPTVTGSETPTFFQYLKMSKGQLYEGVNILDLNDLRNLQTEFKAFVEAPYDLNEINKFLIDNNQNITLDNVQLKITEDLRSQFGLEAIGKFLYNKLPYVDVPFTDMDIGLDEDELFKKTEAFSDLFANIPEWKKIAIGMSIGFGGEEYFKDNPYPQYLQIDPVILEQFNEIYVQQLKNNGVDFSLMKKNPDKFLSEIQEVREQALYSTAYRLNREGFGISNYESMNNGGKLVQNPLENQIPYSNKLDKEMYMTGHIYTHIKSMEAKYGEDKMKDMYPGVYINNFGTSQANEVKLDMKRVNDLLNDGAFYFIKEPGNVYSYNLNPNNIYSNSYEMSMDIDDPQFLSVDDVMTTNDGKQFSKKAIVTEAVKDYLSDNKLLSYFEDQGLNSKYAENFLYAILYPGTYGLTNRDDLLDYLEENKPDIRMFGQ